MKVEKYSVAILNSSPEKYQEKVFFPKKLEKAKEMLKDAKLPPNKHRR